MMQLIVAAREKMSLDTEASEPLPPQRDLPTALIEKLRKIPCFGIAMAFASGICFATASFTVELMRGDSGYGIDASLIVAGRYVPILSLRYAISCIQWQVTRSIRLLPSSRPHTQRSSTWCRRRKAIPVSQIFLRIYLLLTQLLLTGLRQSIRCIIHCFFGSGLCVNFCLPFSGRAMRTVSNHNNSLHADWSDDDRQTRISLSK